MDNPTLARMVEAIDEISEDTARRMIAAAFEGLSDDELRGAYMASDGEPGDPFADLLAVAAEERGIDL
jgi:hypothetical protein